MTVAKIPNTATAKRRHRPSTKDASTSRESARTASSGSKKALAKSKKVEDKREDPDAMVDGARPKNLVGERDDKKRKGKSTHALEASSGKRPSRKSTRRGANHVKPDAQLRRQRVRAVRSPKSRHASASG